MPDLDRQKQHRNMRLLNSGVTALFLGVVGYMGYSAYSYFKNSVTMEFNDLTNADRCLQDVQKYEGVLRLPLPAWKDTDHDSYTIVMLGDRSKDAALLTDEIIAQCEAATSSKRSPAWDALLALRPR